MAGCGSGAGLPLPEVVKGYPTEFTPEMHREFATILTMLLTGKMDQQVVDVPGSDGRSGFVLMDP